MSELTPLEQQYIAQQQQAQQQRQYADALAQQQAAHQQWVQQQWWLQQQRQEQHRQWLASTRPVGMVLAIGLFALAVVRCLMVPVLWGGSMRFFELAIRAPFVGAMVGGGAMAAGWIAVLAAHPRRDQRIVAVGGMLLSVALAVSALGGLMAPDLFRALTSSTMGWLEIGATAATLLGATMWRSGPPATTMVTGWVGLGLMALTHVAMGALGGGGVMFGIIPIATWAVTGAAVIGMRAPIVPTGSPDAMPTARVVQR